MFKPKSSLPIKLFSLVVYQSSHYVCDSLKLSVVIVNYNVKHFLEQCIKSVLTACEGIDAEVWVVDNNSVDGSVAMVQDLFPSVNLIANQENLGFSKANNQAIKASNSEYILLLNPDTIVPEDCFHKTLEFMDHHPEAGACGIRMIDGQGKFLPESKRGLPTPEVALYKMLGLNRLFPRSKKFGKYHLGYIGEFETSEVDVLAGAFMLLRTETLNKVGLLDETFFMYGEDIDLSYRITKGGYKNYYFADSTIIHYKGESTKKQSVNYVKVFYKAMIIFANKHYEGRFRRSFTAFINTAIYLRAGITLISNLVSKYWMMAAELVLIFLSLFFLKDYWEEHIKHIKEYPPAMLYLHLPYYTMSFWLSIYALGGYKDYFRFSKLIKGILLGTALILIIYALLPKELNFSRGIILFGSLVVSACLITFRSIIHLIKYKTLDYSKSKLVKSILVGSEENWEQVKHILNIADKNYQQLGFVDLKKNNHKDCLGNLDQLKEIVSIFEVNEVIFSAETISSMETMQWMNRIGPHVNYYTIPAHSNFIIGSHSKNTNGLYFGQQIELNLSKSEYKQQKRYFDILAAMVLLLVFPLGMLKWGTTNYFSNCFNVLLGKKTWVSYSGSENSHLPSLKPGVFGTVNKNEMEAHIPHLDKLYAKNYTIGMDILSMWRGKI